MKTTKHKFSKGFSLVEIMVAAGMLGALSLAVMKITSIMSSSQKRMGYDLAANQLVMSVTTTLADLASCQQSLVTDMGGALDVNGGTLNKITAKATGQIVAAVGGTYGLDGAGKIELVSMTVKNHTPPSAGQAGAAELHLIFKRVSKTKLELSASTFKKMVPLTVTVDGANKVIDCRTQEHAYNEAMCTAMGGTWNGVSSKCDQINIDAPAGQVAITANVPAGDVAVTANGEINATADIITATNLVSTGGDITAAAGNITANGNITATTGNIAATAGSITANTNITATTGNITATAGNITTNGGNITASGGGGARGAAGSNTISGRYVYASQGIFSAEPNAGDNNIPADQVVTAGWVTRTITDNFLGSMTPAQKTSIYGELLDSTGDLGYETIQNNIIKNVFATDPSTCTSGKFVIRTSLDSSQWKLECETVKTTCSWRDGSTTEYKRTRTIQDERITNENEYGGCECLDGEVLSGMIIRNGYLKPRCRCCLIQLPTGGEPSVPSGDRGLTAAP